MSAESPFPYPDFSSWFQHADAPGQASSEGITASPDEMPSVVQGESTEPLSDSLTSQEQELLERADDLVSQIDLSTILVLARGRTQPPRNIDDYKLVSLVSSRPSMRSLDHAAWSFTTSEPIDFYYGRPGIRPYLDSAVGIGLVYRDGLRAIAGAGITSSQTLRIVQLQGVDTIHREGQDKFATGLHSGFEWRDTLVHAWAQLASGLDIQTIEIQSAGNSAWKGLDHSKDRLKHLARGYDAVALRMGFAYNPSNENFVADIPLGTSGN